MEPAASIIKKLGGPGAVAEFLGTAKNAPYRWTYARERGGTGGIIPHWHHEALLRMASEKGLHLSPADFFPRTKGEAA